MNNPTHTPGPWQAAITPSKVTGRLVWRSNGHGDGYVRICRNVASNADCTLIAAAPEMFEALQVLILDPKINAWLVENDPKALEQASQAIAKAVRG